MDMNPYNPHEVYKVDRVAPRSFSLSKLRFIPAAILMFIGLQVLLAIIVFVVKDALSSNERGPLAPPLYIAMLSISSIVFFGIGLTYAGIEILRRKYENAAVVVGAAVLVLIIGIKIL